MTLVVYWNGLKLLEAAFFITIVIIWLISASIKARKRNRENNSQ